MAFCPFQIKYLYLFFFCETLLLKFYICFAELRHLCVDSEQCDIEMICVVENATKSTGFGRNPNAVSATKICLCDEENGYKEDVEDNRCNGNFVFLFSF